MTRLERGLSLAVVAVLATSCESGAQLDESGTGVPSSRPARASVPPSRPAAHVGVVTAARAVEIAPAVLGKLVVVAAWPGDTVEAGEPLAILDDRPLRAELAIVEAELRSQQARLRGSRVDVEESQATARQLVELAEDGHVAGIERERADFAAQRSRAEVEQVRAAVAQSRARVEQLRREIDECTILAPFTGIVAKRYLDEGAVAGPGTPIVELIAGTTPWVHFAVEPSELGELAVGEVVGVRFEDGREAQATVRHIHPEIDPASEMVFVEAIFKPEISTIAIGLPAWVTTISEL